MAQVTDAKKQVKDNRWIRKQGPLKLVDGTGSYVWINITLLLIYLLGQALLVASIGYSICAWGRLWHLYHCVISKRRVSDGIQRWTNKQARMWEKAERLPCLPEGLYVWVPFQWKTVVVRIISMLNLFRIELHVALGLLFIRRLLTDGSSWHFTLHKCLNVPFGNCHFCFFVVLMQQKRMGP